MTTSTANAYLKTRVMTASPQELRLLLLDGALKFARQGQKGLEEKDPEATYNGISQCRNIILELMNSINTEIDPELALNMRSLYAFMYTELVHASFERDVDRLVSVIELLEYERQTWVMLMEKLATEKDAGAPAASAPAEPAPSSATSNRSISFEA
ncbi:MAG: flagellar export chaperone FliS [Phycisphaerales bacterium]|nr:flagellar export chaperone FliS [Phycisphaerales bacterium]